MTVVGRIAATRRSIASIAAFAAMLAGGGCGAEPLSLAEFEQTRGVAAPTQPDPEADAVREAAGGGTGDFALPPGVTLPEGVRLPEGASGGTPAPERRQPERSEPARAIGFGDGALVAGVATGAVGGEGALAELTLYEGYGIATTLAPGGNVDRVVVRGGRAERPTALPNSAVRDRDGSRFTAAEVAWDLIPSLVERTPTDLGVADGKVSHVTVTKNLPFSPDLVIRVYVTSERDGGRIDYFADGRPMRAFRD